VIYRTASPFAAKTQSQIFSKEIFSCRMKGFVDKLCQRFQTAGRPFLGQLNLIMSVFVRTEEGQEAAYSPQSALPRKLKSILKVIDGRTTLGTFEKNLSSFGDVRAILQSLDMAGLIRQIENSAVSSSSAADLLSDPVNTSPKVASATPVSDWIRTRSLRSQQHSSPARSQTHTSSWQASELSAHTLPAHTLPAHMPSSAGQLVSPVLQELLDSMANFVLTHLPEQSFQILKEIEEITSLELLAVTLGGYEQMVATVGKPSIQHLNVIKQTLRRNL
jgi:hypothetical protein